MYDIVMTTYPESNLIPGIIKHFFFSRRCELTFSNLAEVLTFVKNANYKSHGGFSIGHTEIKASIYLDKITTERNKFSLLFRSEDFFAIKNGITFSELELMLKFFDEKILHEETSKYHVTKKMERFC